MIHRSEEGTADADATLMGGIVAPTAQYVIIVCVQYIALVFMHFTDIKLPFEGWRRTSLDYHRSGI